MQPGATQVGTTRWVEKKPSDMLEGRILIKIMSTKLTPRMLPMGFTIKAS
jgi:hypothetical protein